MERPAGEPHGSGTVLFAQGFTLRGVDEPMTLFATSTPTATNTYTYLYPAGTAFTFQCNFGGRYVNPPMTPTGTVVGDWGTSVGAGASMTLEHVDLDTAGTVAFIAGVAGSGGTARFIVVFNPVPEPSALLLIPAERGILRLGCAENYEVFITRNDAVTMEPEIVDAVGFSKVQWTRALDDISTASVTIPDRLGGVRCCTPLGGLVPWRFGLRIERDGQLVWEGPVVQLRRERGDISAITVTANDQLARFRKRFASLIVVELHELGRR